MPLAIRTAGANASDHRHILPLVLDFPKVGGVPGRPKELPDDLYAIRDYFIGEATGSTAVPSDRSSPGLTITVSPGSIPASTSVSMPKSRPSCTVR